MASRKPSLSPQLARAQDSHWGVTASFVPQWEPIPELYEQLWGEELPVTGREFRVGIVRGSDRGGDWSVSVVRNWFSSDDLLDFTSVEYLSSAALGKLITMDKKVKGAKGKLRLCSIRPDIYEVFAITKLNKLFDIHDDQEKALEGF